MNEQIESKTSENQGKIARLILAVLLIAAATLVALHQDTHKLQIFLKEYGRWSALACVFIYALLGATPVPSEPITVLLTTLFGPWWTALIATVGNTLAALIEFFIGGRINDLSDFEKRKAKLPFHLGKLPIDSPAFLLIGRMLPGFGPKFVSVVSGVYQVPLWTYLWTAGLSNAVGAVVVALGGYSLLQLL
ncbi:MAG: TVP38/TMEM64 family protein [Anaerolineaceae bacterium]|jgi:uncharacterized membrane protein YdjX (TVP38/TMEM64 family)|nr:TVP38/TMEM64 family protein [Anaerolineaceae bacterium]